MITGSGSGRACTIRPLAPAVESSTNRETYPMKNPLNHPWVVLGFERRSEIGGAVRGRLRWPSIVIWLALGLSIGILLLAAIGVVRFTGWLWVLPALNCAAVYGGPRLANRRLLKELEAVCFQACVTCGYPLVGLPETHVCPSCGASYSLASVRAAWVDWFQRTVSGWQAPK